MSRDALHDHPDCQHPKDTVVYRRRYEGGWVCQRLDARCCNCGGVISEWFYCVCCQDSTCCYDCAVNDEQFLTPAEPARDWRVGLAAETTLGKSE